MMKNQLQATLSNEGKEKMIIKEGFMIKKGHIRHNWKSRWFVLYTDYLHYYKVKGDISPKGVIKLKGCSVISPDPEYTKKECVFRLIEILGTEFLLQCSSETDRDSWVHQLGTTIRNLDARMSKTNSIKESNRPTIYSPEPSPQSLERKSTNSPMLEILQNRVTHEDLLTAMQDDEAGVVLKTHNDGEDIYKLCFAGRDLVSWLVTWCFVQTREEGRVVAGELLEKIYLHPLGSASNTTIKRVAARKTFGDDDKYLYRFSQLNLKNGLDVDFELSDDSTDEESDEEAILENFRLTIVKQGFLVKKGQVRNNWKVRKFVLYDEPARLVYINPTKDKKENQTRVRLFGSVIKALKNDEDKAEIISHKGCKTVIREHCFLIQTKKGKKYILQAPTDDERDHWMHLLQDIFDKYDNSF